MNKKLRGYFFLITSTLIYGLFGLYSRFTSGFGPFSQGWIRYSIVLFIIALLFIFKKVIWKKIERQDIKWFLIWILPASFQPILTFIAFNHLPLGVTYFLIYSTMILGGFISGKIFFSEKFDIVKALSLVLVFVGLVLIYQSDISMIKNIYIFFAIGSGLLLGFWNTLTKKVSGNYPELQMMFLDGSSTFVVGLIGSIITRETLPLSSNIGPWVWIVIFALSGIFASLFLIKGFKYVEAQIGSLIMPLEIVFASVFGYIFFGEILKTSTYIGGFIIAISSVLPNIHTTLIKETNPS